MRGAEGGAWVSPPSEVARLPWGQENTATATGVMHCFEEGEYWPEKGGGGEMESGQKRAALECRGSTAPKEWGPSAGDNDCI